MGLVSEIKARREKLGVVGLGYVGLPIAVAFAEKVLTIGFDINEEKIRLYQAGVDPTQEVGNKRVQETGLQFTSDETRLREAKIIIVAVPTPINGDKSPDLTPVIDASKLVGRNLRVGSIVIFESTVYPGVTEDVCLPVLEEASGLRCGFDFKIAYSPERINPGDKVRRLENICKIVSGMDRETLDEVAALYEMIILAGVHRAPSIKVAEAAKLAENAQRDINIAFMNELSMVFHRVGISTKDVLDAMNTKWNALGFYPGLVGGHCIGVDPYYFIYQARCLDYYSQIISAGRRINNHMGMYVADMIIKKLIQGKKSVHQANVYIFGASFKENCPDMRNSKSLDVCHRLEEYGVQVKIVDPVVEHEEFQRSINVELVEFDEVKEADCLVFLVAHEAFLNFSIEDLKNMYVSQRPNEINVLVDIKNIFDREEFETQGFSYWSL